MIHAGAREGSPEPFIRRDIRYVPESKNINVLLKEIQRGPHTMVFAVDEPGDAEAVRRIGPRLLECDGAVPRPGERIETGRARDHGLGVGRPDDPQAPNPRQDRRLRSPRQD